MNMLLHELFDAQIAKGDTMRSPEFTEDGKLQQFDRVIANLMWNQNRWSKEYLQDANPYGRFPMDFHPKIQRTGPGFSTCWPVPIIEVKLVWFWIMKSYSAAGMAEKQEKQSIAPHLSGLQPGDGFFCKSKRSNKKIFPKLIPL